MHLPLGRVNSSSRCFAKGLLVPLSRVLGSCLSHDLVERFGSLAVDSLRSRCRVSFGQGRLRILCVHRFLRSRHADHYSARDRTHRAPEDPKPRNVGNGESSTHPLAEDVPPPFGLQCFGSEGSGSTPTEASYHDTEYPP